MIGRLLWQAIVSCFPPTSSNLGTFVFFSFGWCSGVAATRTMSRLARTVQSTSLYVENREPLQWLKSDDEHDNAEDDGARSHTHRRELTFVDDKEATANTGSASTAPQGGISIREEAKADESSSRFLLFSPEYSPVGVREKVCVRPLKLTFRQESPLLVIEEGEVDDKDSGGRDIPGKEATLSVDSGTKDSSTIVPSPEPASAPDAGEESEERAHEPDAADEKVEEETQVDEGNGEKEDIPSRGKPGLLPLVSETAEDCDTLSSTASFSNLEERLAKAAERARMRKLSSEDKIRHWIRSVNFSQSVSEIGQLRVNEGDD